MQNELEHELHNVLSGKSEVRYGAVVQAIAGYLNDGSSSGSAIENSKHFKNQEEQRLRSFILKTVTATEY